MPIDSLVDINALFDQTLELRHIAGLFYAMSDGIPCSCDGGTPVCGDPDCEDCEYRQPCIRCEVMIRYERWVGYENLPFLHPHRLMIGYRPQCSSYIDETIEGEEHE